MQCLHSTGPHLESSCSKCPAAAWSRIPWQPWWRSCTGSWGGWTAPSLIELYPEGDGGGQACKDEGPGKKTKHGWSKVQCKLKKDVCDRRIYLKIQTTQLDDVVMMVFKEGEDNPPRNLSSLSATTLYSLAQLHFGCFLPPFSVHFFSADCACLHTLAVAASLCFELKLPVKRLDTSHWHRKL